MDDPDNKKAIKNYLSKKHRLDLSDPDKPNEKQISIRLPVDIYYAILSQSQKNGETLSENIRKSLQMAIWPSMMTIKSDNIQRALDGIRDNKDPIVKTELLGYYLLDFHKYLKHLRSIKERYIRLAAEVEDSETQGVKFVDHLMSFVKNWDGVELDDDDDAED